MKRFDWRSGWRWLSRRLRQPTCYRCRFAEALRTNGDGQVSRWQVFCRGSGSPFRDRPIPFDLSCPAWQEREESQPAIPDAARHSPTP